jgi:hypothetical protein
MDFNSTVDLIINDLEEAGKIIDDFKNYPGVPALQVELAKSKCKSAAEVIALLKSNKPAASGAREEKKPVPKMKPEPVFEIETEPVVEIKASQEPVPLIDKALKTETHPDSAIFADTFTGRKGTLNEQIGGKLEESDLLGSLRHQQVSDLSHVIGINDRFLFIREIFNNNAESFNQAVVRLDQADSLEDARAIILSYSGEIKENSAASQLLELVKRKFPGNE